MAKNKETFQRSHRRGSDASKRPIVSREADFGFSFFKNILTKVFNAFGEIKLSLGLVFKLLFASKVGLVLVILMIAVPLTAFEAHVVNVTATIEQRQNECPALSIGYWRNHEGCEQGGGGSSVWETQVQALSVTYSGVFAATTGSGMCQNLWIPNCPSGNDVPAKLCRAKAQTLADELNVVSSRLDLNAIIAGADDGSAAFDNLGLNANSTIDQALAALEAVIANGSSTAGQLTEAAHVAQRIYGFYEDENPQAPMCYYPGQYNGVNETFACGDINRDHEVDATDLSLLTGYVFEGVPIPDLELIDMNGDGVPDILDVVTLTNHVNRGGPAPTCGEVESTTLPASVLNVGLPEISDSPADGEGEDFGESGANATSSEVNTEGQTSNESTTSTESSIPENTETTDPSADQVSAPNPEPEPQPQPPPEPETPPTETPPAETPQQEPVTPPGEPTPTPIE